MGKFTLERIARYPFLPEAKEYISSLGLTLEELQKHPVYGGSLELGRQRVRDSIQMKLNPELSDKISQELSIISYALARILAHLSGSRILLRRYAEGEATKAYEFLKSEPSEVKNSIAGELSLDLNSGRMHFTQYVRLSKDLAKKSQEWKIVNRELDSGTLSLDERELTMLLQEAIKFRIMEPPELRNISPEFKKAAKELKALQPPERELKVKKVNQDAIPPCIRELLSALEAGEASHNAMFILGTFFVGLGLPTEELLRIFSRHPTFDEDKTRYQLEFLTGEKGSTKYSCPSCAKIRSYGLCLETCGVKHPLQYYRDRIKRVRKS